MAVNWLVALHNSSLSPLSINQEPAKPGLREDDFQGTLSKIVLCDIYK